jgi:hypothetical protein
VLADRGDPSPPHALREDEVPHEQPAADPMEQQPTGWTAVLRDTPAATVVAPPAPGTTIAEDPSAFEKTSTVPVMPEQWGPLHADPTFVPPPPHDTLDSRDAVPAPPQREDDDRGPLGRLWSHRSTKLICLCLIVIAAALAAFWGLKHAHKGPAAAPPTSTGVNSHTSTTATSTPTSTTTTVVDPLTAAQTAQYEQYVAALVAANKTAMTGFSGLAIPPAPAQVLPIVTSYLAALKLYNLQVHFVQWPASMQADVAADEGALATLMNYLQGVSTISPTAMMHWLTELHTEGTATQAAEDKVRQSVGAPQTRSFP